MRVRKGLILGVILLLGVDIVWVGSAGISRVSQLSQLYTVRAGKVILSWVHLSHPCPTEQLIAWHLLSSLS